MFCLGFAQAKCYNNNKSFFDKGELGMKNLLVFCGIVLSFFATACGSAVIIEGGDQTAIGGSGGSVTTFTTSDSATGGSGGQELPVELIVTYLGPMNGQLQLGSTDYLFDFSLVSKNHSLSFASIEFKLASLNGGLLLGSSGTAYFSNLNVLDVDGNQIMGPAELSHAENGLTATVTFDEGFVLPPGILIPGKPNLFRLVADLVEAEDSTGEFIGRAYFVSLPPFTKNKVIDQETGLPLEPFQISPQSALNGKPQTVVVP